MDLSELLWCVFFYLSVNLSPESAISFFQDWRALSLEEDWIARERSPMSVWNSFQFRCWHPPTMRLAIGMRTAPICDIEGGPDVETITSHTMRCRRQIKGKFKLRWERTRNGGIWGGETVRPAQNSIKQKFILEKYFRHNFSFSDLGTPSPSKMDEFSEKFQRGGGGVFISDSTKNYIADLGPGVLKKIAIWFSES